MPPPNLSGLLSAATIFFSLELDDFVEMGVALKHAARLVLDRPRDVGVRVFVPQRRKRGQGAHNVSDGAEPDDEDPAGPVAFCGICHIWMFPENTSFFTPEL
jgi:hypothetical protein